MDNSTVERIVAAAVHEQLSPSSVQVVLRKGTDHDGDALLNVTVIIASDTPAPDKRKMLGLAGHIRAKLDEAKIDDFPLVSFVSKRDAAKLNFEAA